MGHILCVDVKIWRDKTHDGSRVSLAKLSRRLLAILRIHKAWFLGGGGEVRMLDEKFWSHCFFRHKDITLEFLRIVAINLVVFLKDWSSFNLAFLSLPRPLKITLYVCVVSPAMVAQCSRPPSSSVVARRQSESDFSKSDEVSWDASWLETETLSTLENWVPKK